MDPIIEKLGLEPHPERGTWFGTELGAGASHCLVGCTVAPGFEFSDFEMAQGAELEARYPAVADRIRRMSRP